MKTNRVLLLALTVLLVLALIAGCGTKPAAPAASTEPAAPAEKTKIAFISYMPIDSAEFLQNLVKGLKDYEATSGKVEIKVIEATQASEYEPKIKAACDAGYQIVLTTYDSMAQATIAVAAQYPDIKFGILDGGIENIADYKNIQNFRLSRVETGFMAGYVAGKMTKTNKVGIVAGADVGPINEIIAGWQQGLRYANPKIEDIVVYANTFTDPTKGKELGLTLFTQGCDIIGGAAGGTGVGAAQAAADQKKYYVAWDVHYPDVVKDLELGSALNYFDKMFIAFIEDALNGKYAPGTNSIYGIKEGACTFEFCDNNLVNGDIRKEVEGVAAKIASGEIKIDLAPIHK